MKSDTRPWYAKITASGFTMQVHSVRPESKRSRESLFFGKFVDGSAIAIWHGYPADYRRRTQDRPPISVLQVRVMRGLVQKHHVAKIPGGMQCSL